MDFLLADIFSEIAVILMLSAAIGALGLRLKQPLIVSFIAVGILVGPSVLGWVESNDQIDLLAKLGIALLLFLVGLKLDLHIIKTMGPVALAAGLGQVVFTSVFGFGIAWLLGMDTITALYVAVALTFSSTIIIVKLLSDKRELDDLHGRIAIGFLIVQDIVVVMVMIGLTALGQADSDRSLGQEALRVGINGALFILAVALAMRFVLTPLLKRLAENSEMLILFAIAWAVSLGATGVHLGFSKEVGAFLAGIAIASTPYKDMIGARLTSLRDFLLLFFFIDLAVNLDMSVLGSQIIPALIFSAFVLIGNPIIVIIILRAMGYSTRTGFMAGLTVAQISEFSLILGATGLNQGHIDTETLGLITLVGLITISLSTYMILYSEPLWNWLSKTFNLTAMKEQQATMANDHSYDIILFGIGRFGKLLAESFHQQGQRVLAIDNNPDRIAELQSEAFELRFGDMEAPEFISQLPLNKNTFVLSSLRNLPANLALIQNLNDAGFDGVTTVLADSQSDIELLESAGANHAIMPHTQVAQDIVGALARQ